MRQSPTWPLEDTRIAFWKSCQSILNKHGVTSGVASAFFRVSSSFVSHVYVVKRYSKMTL